jgi:hypothetical protein
MGTQQLVKRDEFSAVEIYGQPETAATAVAARERAAIEARYVVAIKRPRDMDDVRVRLLKECDRTGFAAVARYIKPIGKDASKWPKGPSIRFAETALRCFGNVYPEQSIVFEDDSQRIVRVTVTDLEANVSYSSEILVKKTVERKYLKEGQEVISERVNSQGDRTYLVYATDDDVQNKQNALISKAIRNNGLRIIPGDLVEECMERVLATQNVEDKKDPDSAKRKIIDAFAAVGVLPADLHAFLGHGLDRVQPAELAELRAAHSAIKDGETTWDAIMENRGVRTTVADQTTMAEQKIAAAKRAVAQPMPITPVFVASDDDIPPEIGAAEQAAQRADIDSGSEPLTEAEMAAATRAAHEREQKDERAYELSPLSTGRKPIFGRQRK